MKTQATWESVSQAARDTMKFIGNFGPTVHASEKEVKGYMYDDQGGEHDWLLEVFHQ